MTEELVTLETAKLLKEKEFFLDKSEAIKKAEEMKKRKIASLRKQIEKLEKMTF